MAHTLESKFDVDAFVAAVKQSGSTMAEVAAGVIVGTPLEVQPAPVDTAASVEVAPIAWQYLDELLSRASTDPLHPAFDVSKNAIVEGVKRLLRARYLQGLAKYGTPLKTHNGRHAIADAVQEMIDGVLYTSQGIAEDWSVHHQDQALIRALDHIVAALINLAAVVDANIAGDALGRPHLRVPREAIEAPEQIEAAPNVVYAGGHTYEGSEQQVDVRIDPTVVVRAEENLDHTDEEAVEVEAAIEEDGGDLRR